MADLVTLGAPVSWLLVDRAEITDRDDLRRAIMPVTVLINPACQQPGQRDPAANTDLR